jgi:splicing factor U2AF 65 kDa subunit
MYHSIVLTRVEIEEDISEECEKFGKILAFKMPRPSGARINAGVGKVYIKYDTVESATRAMAALAGRKFESRTVVVTQFSEELFEANAW